MKKIKTLFVQPINGLGQIENAPIDIRINAALEKNNITTDNIVNIQVHQDSINNNGQIILFYSATIIYLQNAITEN